MILSVDIERLASLPSDYGLKIHIKLGLGLMESACEAALEHRLTKMEQVVERQKAISIRADGLILPDAFRADLLTKDKIIFALKSVEKLAVGHHMQTLKYLSLMKLPRRLLMNFGRKIFNQGIKRIISNHAI